MSLIHEKRNTFIAIVAVFTMMFSMLVFIPMDAKATNTSSINASAVIWADGPDGNSAYISGHDDPWAYGRFVFAKFDLSSIPTGSTIDAVRVFFYDYSGSNSPVAINATYAFGGNGGGISMSRAQLVAMSPDSSFVMDMTFTSAGYWNASGMHALWQTQFDNNATIYIGCSAWNWPGTVTSNGIGTTGIYIPKVVVSYTEVATWAPTFTSSPVTTGTDGESYSEIISLNETSTITSVQIPSWMSNALNNSETDSFMISGTAVTGSYNIVLRAVSVAGTLTAWQNFTLVVGAAPTLWPVTFISSPITTIQNNHIYSYTARWNQSGTVVYEGGPSWMSSQYNNSNQVSTALYGLPTAVGSFDVHLKVTSVAGTLPAWQNFTITVTAFTPWVSYVTNSPPLTVKVGEPYYWVPTFNETVTISEGFGTVDIMPQIGGAISGTTMGTSNTIQTINLGFRFYGAGMIPTWYNWSVFVSAVPILEFTSTPGDAINHTMYLYSYTTSYNVMTYNGTSHSVVVTKVSGPSWLSISGGKLRGVPPATGVFTVSLMVHDTSPFDQYAWQNFTLTVLPYGSNTLGGEVLNLIVPLIIVLMVTVVCAISRTGISINAGMGGMTVAIAVLTWAGALPWWAYIISIGVLAMMIAKAVRSQ